MKLLSSTNTELSGGAQYYAGGWKIFGVGTTTGTMELLPLTYTFQVSYGGASQQLSQNVANNPNAVFHTKLVTMKLLSSDGSAESTGTTQYYAGGWKTFGGGTTTTTMELLPLTYTFQISYKGASQQKSQDVNKDANVNFQTTSVTVKLVSSTNTELIGGRVQYFAGGWKTFSSGTTTASMELLPLTYTFQVSWAGASQQKSQNVATNANVIFQTVQVHSDSSKCTSYYASGWRTFTQDMELLPGTYTFRFSDGTVNTSYTLVVGAGKHIH
jgi:cellobiose-specific phosphotransferase system component IIC